MYNQKLNKNFFEANDFRGKKVNIKYDSINGCIYDKEVYTRLANGYFIELTRKYGKEFFDLTVMKENKTVLYSNMIKNVADLYNKLRRI